MATQEFHERLMAYVGRLKQCTTLHALRGTFTSVIVPLGFQQFAYVPHKGEEILLDWLIYTYPETWRVQYVSKSYQKIDPVWLSAMSATEPFVWSADDYADRLELRAFFSEAKKYDLNWGVVIPLKATPKADAFLTCTGAAEPSNTGLNRGQLIVACQLLADVFHQCAMRISGSIGPSTLRPREVQVLELTALGLSGQEISTLLGLSSTYVAEVSQNVTRKFGTRNKLSALWRARELGLL